MRRVFLSLVMLLVLSATFVHADVIELREPSFPGAGADEGDPFIYNGPDGTAMVIGDLLSL